jgi:hypothetical protein
MVLSLRLRNRAAGWAPQIALISATSKARRIVRGQLMLSSPQPKNFRRGIDPGGFIARENNGAIGRQSRNARYPT